jgi:hypothetical protein
MNSEQTFRLSVFLELLKRPAVESLLENQPMIDKYNLAACFVYFLRAGLQPQPEYNIKNLAICLYIDNLIQVTRAIPINIQEDDCVANDCLKDDIEKLCATLGLFATKTTFRVLFIGIVLIQGRNLELSCKDELESNCRLQDCSSSITFSLDSHQKVCSSVHGAAAMMRIRSTPTISKRKSMDLLDEIESHPCCCEQCEPHRLKRIAINASD